MLPVNSGDHQAVGYESNYSVFDTTHNKPLPTPFKNTGQQIVVGAPLDVLINNGSEMELDTTDDTTNISPSVLTGEDMCVTRPYNPTTDTNVAKEKMQKTINHIEDGMSSITAAIVSDLMEAKDWSIGVLNTMVKSRDDSIKELTEKVSIDVDLIKALTEKVNNDAALIKELTEKVDSDAALIKKLNKSLDKIHEDNDGLCSSLRDLDAIIHQRNGYINYLHLQLEHITNLKEFPPLPVSRATFDLVRPPFNFSVRGSDAGTVFNAKFHRN